MRVRPDKEKLDSDFLAHYWGNPNLRKELINNSRTSTMTTMNQDDLSKVEIPLPSIGRQKELAKFFTEKMATVEQLKTTLQTQLESINQLPAALLKQAFSGQL